MIYINLQRLYEDIRAEIDAMELLSTHEHNLLPEQGTPVTLDYIFRHSYVGWCGIGTGKTPEERQVFLDKVGVNSYYRWLLFSLQDLYNFTGEITVENWDEISQRIFEAHKDPQWYFDIMKERGRVKRAIQDAYWDPGSDNGHPEFYSPTFRINALVTSYSPDVKDHNGNNAFDLFAAHDMEVHSFDDYLQAVDSLILQKKAEGCVALKSALAYDRPLSFADIPRAEAEQVFNKRGDGVSPQEAKAFEDFMFHFIAGKAGEVDLPLQCHVGLGKVEGSNPMNMLSVIEKYPGTKFVLFHGGYPWFHQIGGFLHNYDNVYADMVWLPLISPTAAATALHEWIEIARTSEKIAWGGDCWVPEETYGAVLAIKHVLARVLAEKVTTGYLGQDRALRLAKQILSENARKLYRL